jgi:hypothetical protein
MKTVRIKNTINSADMVTLEIYHTSITGSNLLTSSISSSGIFTGQDLYHGLQFQVEDDVTQFYVKNLTRCTNVGSGSLSENVNNVRFITVDPGTHGSINAIGETSSTFSTTRVIRHNFSVYPILQLTVVPVYPYEFIGWKVDGSSAITEVDNPLLINSSTSGTSFIAVYS